MTQAETPRREWQPIESAPSGAMCLFCSMETGDVSKWCFVDWLAGGKFMLHPKWSATHWMPLPDPPQGGTLTMAIVKHDPGFTCPECGPHVPADEDGCCRLCGRDCNGNHLIDVTRKLKEAQARIAQLTLERDSSRDQFDRHVEWATEHEQAVLREAHDVIARALAAKDEDQAWGILTAYQERRQQQKETRGDADRATRLDA